MITRFLNNFMCELEHTVINSLTRKGNTRHTMFFVTQTLYGLTQLYSHTETRGYMVGEWFAPLAYSKKITGSSLGWLT